MVPSLQLWDTFAADANGPRRFVAESAHRAVIHGWTGDQHRGQKGVGRGSRDSFATVGHNLGQRKFFSIFCFAATVVKMAAARTPRPASERFAGEVGCRDAIGKPVPNVSRDQKASQAYTDL
jgi:hypothetical protein